MITGIICEYNPLHLGHSKQIKAIKAAFPEDFVVCLMSGNYVQRGKPAIFDKMVRAKAAVLTGADLVLELPLPYALSSAEGFAAGGVRILGSFCDRLCFGCEDANETALIETAKALLSDTYREKLKIHLDSGISFPAARQKALEELGYTKINLSAPNNTLALEYCKAILAQACSMKPMPISRKGDYHDKEADGENPSATAVRNLIEGGKRWQAYVPREAVECLENATVHTLENGERAILAKLRTMADEEFEALPYGAEGLWRKLMKACRQCASLEEIFTAVKSKRYTRSRLDRMVMCAFLGLTQQALSSPAPYVRVLAFNDQGREVLKKARQYGEFYNIGQPVDHPYQQLEYSATALYGLFAESCEPSNAEEKYRVYCG